MKPLPDRKNVDNGDYRPVKRIIPGQRLCYFLLSPGPRYAASFREMTGENMKPLFKLLYLLPLCSPLSYNIDNRLCKLYSCVDSA